MPITCQVLWWDLGIKYEVRGRDLSMSKISSLPQRKKNSRKDTNMQIVVSQCDKSFYKCMN